MVGWRTERGRPWLTGGDWNVEAEEVEARKRRLGGPCQLLTTSNDDQTCFATAGGNRLDHFAGAKLFGDLTSTVQIMDTSIAKRRAVAINSAQLVGNRMVEVVKTSKGVAGRPAFGPMPEGFKAERLQEVTKKIKDICRTAIRTEGALADQGEIDKAWEEFLDEVRIWIANTFGTNGRLKRSSSRRPWPGARLQKTKRGESGEL